MSSEESKILLEEKYESVKWSPLEKLISKHFDLKDRLSLSFDSALRLKFRRSIFGCFLKFFNEQQQQDKHLNENKLGIGHWNIIEFNDAEMKHFKDDNIMFGRYITLLNSAVKEEDEIDWDFLYRRLTTLKLHDMNIFSIGGNLRNFKNLQVLILCGNWLNDLDGSCLPRHLKFLELYVNELTTTKNLCKNAPKTLLHLGLGRNKLTNESQLHFIPASQNFDSLKNLDLSECDICDLTRTLNDLKALTKLESLCLYGNPCSMMAGYKISTLKLMPNLYFLDKIKLDKPEKNSVEKQIENEYESAIILYCHKIIGLPAPPKDKKSKQTIHIEFKLPLIETENLVSQTEFQEPSVKIDKKKKSSKSPYDKPDDPNLSLNKNVFKTEKKVWAKKGITYKPLTIEPPNNNLKLLRDTFRSSVNVRVIYMKVLIPKKEKKTKKNKNASKTTIKDKPKDILLKRTTLANFYCDLRDIKWNAASLDYLWNETPEMGNKAQLIMRETEEEYMDEDNVDDFPKKQITKVKTPEEEVKKDDKRKKIKEKNKGKDKKSQKKNKDNKKKTKGKKKDVFTCQIGFGLKRY